MFRFNYLFVLFVSLLAFAGCCTAPAEFQDNPELVWRQDLMPLDAYNLELKLGKPFDKVEYITIHNTAEPLTASQERDRVATRADGMPVSFHFAVDENEAVQILPLEYGGWHAGDGSKGGGNSKSIGIEICRSQWRDAEHGKWYYQSEENAARLAAILLDRYDLPTEALRMHQDWSGKFCPHRILEREGWAYFKARVDSLRHQVKVIDRDSDERFDTAATAAVVLHDRGERANGTRKIGYVLVNGKEFSNAESLAGYLKRTGQSVLISSWVRNDDGQELIGILREAEIPVEGYFVMIPENPDYERVNLMENGN